MEFFLGTHKPHWLRSVEVPLFISRRTITLMVNKPKACERWALDSGGFSELSMFGEWRTSPERYVDEVRELASVCGKLEWAAIQDWMCEPFILEKTGLSVRDHQLRTVDSFEKLKRLAPEVAWTPVLQGWSLRDYAAHWKMYKLRGHSLESLPIVGVGSVCRRQGTQEIVDIMRYLNGLGIKLHGFGIKLKGLLELAPYLHSADSLAWSFDARYADPMPGCTHASCANCVKYAMRWRDNLVGRLNRWQSETTRLR